MRSKSSRALWLLALLLVAVALAGRFELHRPSANDSEIRLQVPAGASLRGVLNDLAARQGVRHPRLVEWYARFQYRGVPMTQIGTYLIPAHITPLQLLEQLRNGRVVFEQFTIIEGWNFAQLRHALATSKTLVHAWIKLSDVQLMSELGQAGLHPEGQFFPDTYRYAEGTPDSRIYQLAYDRMQTELASAWAQRDTDLQLKSPYELLTFASIVEKETARQDERGRVAAVFANRLRLGMRLQSDPTVIYGIGASYDGDIRSRDLTTDTPYNSYTRVGLPPTPIALPGAESLRAAAHPESSDALFFVATGNGDGSHHFSATLAEHNAAVQRFLQRTRGTH
jgi:UPF0755 protein